MRIDNRSGGLRPPQQTKIPLARLYYTIWCCGGRRPPLRKRCSSCSGKRQSRAETTAPPGDSGGIQTHDLQNFFSTKSFCSKTKKVQLRQLHLILYAAEAGDLRYFSDSGGIQTHDLQNRNLTLYSAKLRNHCDFAVANLRKLFQTDERLLHKKRAEQTFS